MGKIFDKILGEIICDLEELNDKKNIANDSVTELIQNLAKNNKSAEKADVEKFNFYIKNLIRINNEIEEYIKILEKLKNIEKTIDS